jgi:cytoskeletal protein RodZ
MDGCLLLPGDAGRSTSRAAILKSFTASRERRETIGMPLDTGEIEVEVEVAHEGRAPVAPDGLASLRPLPIQLDETVNVGAALAAARRSLGLAIEDIASATRVRTGYVAAIEAFRFEALPARPFVIGYVRAYAMALGLDADAVVARFRAEAPGVEADLRAPVGVERHIPLAPRIIGVLALFVVASVVGWNVWRHAEARPLRSPAPIPVIATAPAGPVLVGAPPPTPPEASTPPAYRTPGLPQPGASPTAASHTAPSKPTVASTPA